LRYRQSERTISVVHRPVMLAPVVVRLAQELLGEQLSVHPMLRL
jgi:hypothetical protein